MKNEKGITLTSLVIMIIVLIILASIATYSGVGTIRYTNYNKAKAEMEMMQANVNAWYQQYTNIEVKDEEIPAGETKEQVLAEKQQNFIGEYGEVANDPAACDQTKLNNTIHDIQEKGYTATAGDFRFLSAQFLKNKLGNDIAYDYLVNIPKRQVILFDGIMYDGKKYYTAEDFGILNVAYNGMQGITFDVEQGNNKEIIIYNVKMTDSENRPTDIIKFLVEYKKTADSTWSDATANLTKFVDENDENKVKYKFTVEGGGDYNIRISSIDRVISGTNNLAVVAGYLGITELADKKVKLTLNVDAGGDQYSYKVYVKDGPTETLRILAQGTSTQTTLETNEIDTFFDVGIEDSYVELQIRDTVIQTNHCAYEDLKIKTAQELNFLATRVNEGKTFEGKTITQIADIDLQGSENNQWTAIGTDTYRFRGIFDATNHFITNIYLNNVLNNQGLFGYSSGTIKDLTVSGNVTSTNQYIGGIVGYNNSGEISNCTSNVTVSGNANVGGIVGVSKSGTIRQCANTGRIQGIGDYVGGICGQCNTNLNIVSECKNVGNIGGRRSVGGIVGLSNYTTMSFCYNSGNINAEAFVGGVIGRSDDNTQIINSYNKGEIEATGRDNNYTYVGGITARLRARGKISDCYNTGPVQNTSDSGRESGGIIGDVNSFNGSTCEEERASTVQYSYNNANVTSNGLVVGGIAGVNNPYCVVRDCYIGSLVTVNNGTTASKDIGTSSYFCGKIVGMNNNSTATIGNTTLSTSTNVGTLSTMPSVYEVVNGLNGVLNDGASTIWDDSEKSAPKLKWEL